MIEQKYRGDVPATQMTTAEGPTMYRRLASAVGAEHWQGAVDEQEKAIRSNQFLGDYLRSEYAISYQLERLRMLVAEFDKVPGAACNDQSIFPSLAFAAQVLGVVDRSSPKQRRTFIKRVRNAFASSENMHGLRLELQAATHFARRGHRVAWHRVKGGGTFDLLIEDLGPLGLEVECKSISENKGRRIHRRDVLEFRGELWKDVTAIAQRLHSGLAVVLTVPNRLPKDPSKRAALAKDVISRIMAGTGADLTGGANLRLHQFDPAEIKAAGDEGQDKLRKAIDAATETAHREVVVYETPGGGMLALVMQSAEADDVLNQVFATLDVSARQQFTGQRGALFWVALQGLDADELLSVHQQDGTPGAQPSALRLGVSSFLNRAPSHVVGVVFGSKSGLLPAIGNSMDSRGTTNFYLKEESPHWHASFHGPLRPPEMMG